MGIIQRVSIKGFLTGVVGLLVVIFVIQSLMGFFDKYNYKREMERVDIANELVDYMLEATGYEAKERGMTVIALNSTAVVDPTAF